MKDQRLESKIVIGGMDVIATKKKRKGKKKTDRRQQKKRKTVKTDADAALAQSMEILQLNTMSSSSYTDTDIITLEYQSQGITALLASYPITPLIQVQYQSQNHLDFPTLASECDRYGISDRAAASFASSVLQDIGIVYEGETSHVVDRNKIRRQRKKL
ncbi:hypothetical protein AVEN_25151-1 [Araneus ventricosus]|uniref:Uncharacterized protein n=1 Tax=Araneus ventricosus TaxID=182803 RepID=A0A4Y2FJ24_ARAVE|nr:hypothetical protein AVEN_25151-1 [Araneus ventricosus]